MHRIPVLLLLAVAACNVQAQSPKALTIPLSRVVKYDTGTFDERVEAVAVTRIRLDGPRTITMDPVPGFVIGDTSGKYSALFEREHSSDICAGLIVFPARFFSPDLNPGVLSRYLESLAATRPKSQNFETLEAPAENSGPAKFRFLGTKAYTLRYAYDLPGAAGARERRIHAESWNLFDGMFYVFVVEAPADHFDRTFDTVRRAASTMHFADS